MISVSMVHLGEDVEQAVLAVLRSGQLAQGPVVRQLEERFAEMAGVDHAIAVNNGTTALIAALEVLDLEPGDEVITSPFTFIATLNAIVKAGATARFADIGESDFNVDPDSVASLVGRRTKVLLPVHLYGQAADMGPIGDTARASGLAVVEDAAQAHFATYDNRSVGSWGIGCYSLYGTKNLTSGEGGIITTADDRVADRLRLLRNQGMRQRYQYEMAGNNYRLTDLQAAVCVPQLARYDETVSTRRRNAAGLSERLSEVSWLKLPTELAGRGHVWHQYTVLVAPDAPVNRDELASHLLGRGVGSGVYYPALVNQVDCFRGHPQVAHDDPTPVASSVTSRCLSLPVHPFLSESDLDEIADAVLSVAQK